MKKIVFAMGLLVSIFLGQNTYAQCNNKLMYQVGGFESDKVVNGFAYYDLDGLTIRTSDSVPQNYLAIGVLLINKGDKKFAKKDTVVYNMILIGNGDTIRSNNIYHQMTFDWMPGDTIGLLDDSCFFRLYKLKKGTYKVYASVIYTSKDGYFCDSIVELSSKTVTFYVDTKAPVQQVAQETSLNVFPNPARERINVECETEMRCVTLCNALGQQVLRVNPNAPQAELSVSGLPRGLYLLKVETVGGSTVRKVVVE